MAVTIGARRGNTVFTVCATRRAGRDKTAKSSSTELVGQIMEVKLGFRAARRRPLPPLSDLRGLHYRNIRTGAMR